MRRPVERVVIIGSDAPAWLAALALRRAFEGVAVHVVELPQLLRPVDAYVALPTLENLHRLLGINDEKLIGLCAGVYAFGQRFANWSRTAPPFMHAYDTCGQAYNNIDFLQFWLKARAAGMRVALEDFSLGAAAAKQGRYVLDNAAIRSYSRAMAGRHLDAMSYTTVLKHFALKAGVTVTEAQIDAVRVEGERIVSVRTREGQSVEGDLFIDATGSDAALIRRMPNATVERWDQWFPCNRIMSGSGARLDPLPAFSQIAAFRVGWVGMYPLQDRTAVSAVYDYNLISDQEVMEQLATLSGLRLEGAATVTPFSPGVRPRAWIGNCVAIGEAAMVLEPLDAVPLHFLQVCVSHLVSLFPVDSDRMLEAGAYNESIASHGRNMRDFQIAHYKLNRRVDERLWDRARDIEVPPTLAHKLDLFKRRGRVALYDNETFQDSSWASIFIGHGLIPESYDPLADMVDEGEQMQQFQNFLRFIASEVQALPSMEAHVEMHAPLQRAGMF